MAADEAAGTCNEYSHRSDKLKLWLGQPSAFPRGRYLLLAPSNAYAGFALIKSDNFQPRIRKPFPHIFGRMAVSITRAIPIKVSNHTVAVIQEWIPVTLEHVPVDKPLKVIGPSVNAKSGNIREPLSLR